MAKIEINRRLYWIYANCRDGQKEITRRLYRIKCTCIDYQNEIVIMLIKEMAKKN